MPPATVCEFIVRFDGATALRCPALVEPGSAFCAVHRHGTLPPPKPKPPTLPRKSPSRRAL